MSSCMPSNRIDLIPIFTLPQPLDGSAYGRAVDSAAVTPCTDRKCATDCDENRLTTPRPRSAIVT
jgi:hypothetical protein